MPLVLRSRRRALAKSRFRSRFKLDETDRKYIDRVGLSTIRRHALDFIEKRLAPAVPAKDGHQTPFKGHPVFKAQHATATCCRGCLEKWYGIQKGVPLAAREIEFLADGIMGWVIEQTGDGQRHPSACLKDLT